MNLSLQDPFAVAKEYPENLTQTLQCGYSVFIQFNHKGDYLASGLSDGSVIIYDLMVNGSVIAHLEKGGHTRPISSISWSRCSRYLLTAGQDWKCKLWDLNRVNGAEKGHETDTAVIREIRFDGPIWQASLHPRNHMVFTAALYEDSPVYVDMTDAKNILVRILQTTPRPYQIAREEQGSNHSTDEIEGEEEKRKRQKQDRQLTLVTSFIPGDGAYILCGTSKGWLNIISSGTLETVHSLKFTSANIKGLNISPNGRKLAINSSDRIIRQVDLPDLHNVDDPGQWEFEVEHKYQDLVNRLQWNLVAFNHNAEFLVASTFGQSSQDLYVWETSLGSLIKILEGSNEELLDVKWNHSKCMIGATGIDSGAVYLWQIQFPQKWSALAPDFVEVEENIEYEEKEDEFDVIDEDLLNKRRLEEEDISVDILTKETVDARGFDIYQPSFIIPVDYENSPANIL